MTYHQSKSMLCVPPIYPTNANVSLQVYTDKFKFSQQFITSKKSISYGTSYVIIYIAHLPNRFN